ncbi:MAG: TauD/TfdA family dioxygenase [Alphaproteobacteria bacterium]
MDGSVATARGYDVLDITQWNPSFGAVVGNIELTRPLDDATLAELKRAFTQYGVLFFRDQQISFDDHARLAEYFGSIGQHVGPKTNSQVTDDPRVRKFHADGATPRVSGNVWHTDQSCAPMPPMASILYLHTIPQNGGGDTGFADMYAAYEALSDRMKAYLDGMTAHHEGVQHFGPGSPEADHPVIVRHPESGRKLLFVNHGFTTRLNGVPREESDGILSFLLQHCIRPEWTTRFRWEPHSIAFWDNRCVQHRAIADYLPQPRSGYRVQIEGVAAPVAA